MTLNLYSPATFDDLRAAYPTQPIEIIQRLGCEPDTWRALVCDGKVGPRTRSALYLDPRDVEALDHKLGAVALDFVMQGAREIAPKPGVSASNRGHWVNTFCRLGPRASVDVDRGAWCAFFASYALDLWAREYHASSFKKVGGARRLVRDELPRRVPLAEVQPGDLVAWESLTRPSPYGHVGIVALVTEALVWTVEGNVDLIPGVDGVATRCFARDLIRADGARPLYAARLVL